MKYGDPIKVIESAISEEMLENFLTANWGTDLRVWADGTFDLVPSNITDTGNESSLVSRIQCPGIGNIGEEFFTDQFCEYSEEEGIYIEILSGRKIGTLKDVVHECVRDGDVTILFEDLRDSLLDGIAF